MGSAASAWGCFAFQSLERSRTKQNIPSAEQMHGKHENTRRHFHETSSKPILSHPSLPFLLRPRERVQVRALENGRPAHRRPESSQRIRELRSPAELRKVLTQKISAQQGNCGICHLPLTDCNDIVPDHIEPKGMGAAWRDDHPDNIQAAHRLCNLLKGSRRLSHHQSSE